MKHKTLGQTDIQITDICLGTMTWGNQNSEAEGHEQMDYALEKGVFFWDTAEMYAVPPSEETYGRTETIIGKWFHKTGKRKEVVLASKIAGPGPDYIRGGKQPIDKKNLNEALEASLKRLQTDYIDLYQLHWPNRPFYHFQKHWDFAPEFDAKRVEENFLEVLETLNSFIQHGKIRAIGLSNESAWGAMTYLRLAEKYNLPRMASIQNEYNLLCRIFEPDLSELALAENMGLLAWSPLARGMISGKYLDGAKPKGARLSLETRPDRRSSPSTDEAIRAYMSVAEKHGLDVCQMAIAFTLTRPFVSSSIIGATSMRQLKTNIAAAELKLSQETLDDIHQVYRKFPMVY